MKIITKIKLIRKNTGFTLVEALVSISIFTFAVLGMISILGSGITDVRYARQKIIATYLAQEGIEYFHNLRDNYMLFNPGIGWNDFLTKANFKQCTNLANGCGFEDSIPVLPLNLNSNNVFKCGVPTCELNSSNAKYTSALVPGADSGFKRVINIDLVTDPDPNKVVLISTVSWVQGSGIYKISLSEDLFNWY
jgi:hypothetical protein